MYHSDQRDKKTLTNQHLKEYLIVTISLVLNTPMFDADYML